MASFITFCSVESDLALIRDTVGDAAAYLDDDEWTMQFYSLLSDFSDNASGGFLWDMMCFDVSPDTASDVLAEQRNKDNSSKLMIIADPDTSPLRYIRPGILATTLVLRPLDGSTLAARFKELYYAALADSAAVSGAGESVFCFKAPEGTVRVSYANILYFESRNKKLYVRTKKTEFSFYDTLDNLTQTLPEQFIRCHKSFIVNKRFITCISVSKGEIELEDGIFLPLSRSYKQLVKDATL